MDMRASNAIDEVHAAMSPIGLSRKEQAVFVAGYSCSELGRLLARDTAFRGYVEAIQRGEQSVDDIARRYFPDAAKRRTIIAGVIALAVRKHSRICDQTQPDHRWLLVELSLVNAAPSMCWTSDALVLGEPQRRLQDGETRHTAAAITRGAELIARLGAGRCLECGAALSARTRPSPRSGSVERWQRIRYCDCCDGDVLRESHDGLIRRVIADVGLSLGIDEAASRRRLVGRLRAPDSGPRLNGSPSGARQLRASPPPIPSGPERSPAAVSPAFPGNLPVVRNPSENQLF